MFGQDSVNFFCIARQIVTGWVCCNITFFFYGILFSPVVPLQYIIFLRGESSLDLESLKECCCLVKVLYLEQTKYRIYTILWIPLLNIL